MSLIQHISLVQFNFAATAISPDDGLSLNKSLPFVCSCFYAGLGSTDEGHHFSDPGTLRSKHIEIDFAAKYDASNHS